MDNNPCLGNRDRLMNWVVGLLLTLGVAIVVTLQVRPPV
jgi:hypothetical protein